MIFKKQTDIDWADQGVYKRGVMMPFGEYSDDSIQAQVVEIKSGQTVGRHYHKKQTEFIYLIDGLCRFTVGDETFDMEPGDMIVTEPGDVHMTANVGDRPLRFFVVKINGAADDTVWVDE